VRCLSPYLGASFVMLLFVKLASPVYFSFNQSWAFPGLFQKKKHNCNRGGAGGRCRCLRGVPEVDERGLAEIGNSKEDTRGTQFRQVRAARCVIPYVLYAAWLWID
jgi:hypothetical protein